jgi:hypothetical protein
MLLYDHMLTLPEEIALVWKAPPSFAKYGFLLNRYAVPSMLIAVAYGKLLLIIEIPYNDLPVVMCGFSDVPPTDDVGVQVAYALEL